MATFASFANANSVCASRGGGNCITNTAFGFDALLNNSSGYSNTAIGRNALRNNSSGNRNTAIGYQALITNTTGYCNTAVGFQAGYLFNSTNLTAVGYQAARNTTGASNTMIGFRAGCNVTSGVANVLIGAFAGCGMQGGSCNVGVGAFALRSATSSQNTAIGHNASCGVTTGGCNIAVGYKAGDKVTTATCTISVGYNSSPGNSAGHTSWGNSSMFRNGIAAAWTNVSDCRDKTNIQDLDEKLGLDFIRNLETVSFNFDHRDRYVRKCGYEYGTKDNTLADPKKSYGFIAQQMKQLVESLNTTFDAVGYTEEQDAYRLTYEAMIAPLVKAVQQTSQRLETLEALAG
jgi:hypothetical protein